jgi:hypothetical protein
MNRMTIKMATWVVTGLIAFDALSETGYPLESDVASLDAIIRAYYDVISGPAGYQYDVKRDQSLHAPDAIITRITADGSLQRHDLATEQLPLREPYAEGFFEHEISRIVEEYGGLAHVWSTYEVRSTPDGAATSRGVNSISLFYHADRWWIASWSTQLEGKSPLPSKYVTK